MVEELTDADLEPVRITAAELMPSLRLLLDVFCLVFDRPASYQRAGQKLLMFIHSSVSMTSGELPMKQRQGSARCPWMILPGKEASEENLADIRLRLECLLWNEVVIQRTNGPMRRFLSPLKMRIGRGGITARLMIAKHRHPHVDRERPQARPRETLHKSRDVNCIIPWRY
jgi:hypothetical protein